MAAIPPEVRPHALDGAGDVARVALRAVGIRPGVAVFEASPAPTTRLVRNDCIALRGIDAAGRTHTIAPPDGHCVTSGARWRASWIEGLVRSVVLRAPAGVAEAALGDWVCHAPRFAAQGFRSVELAWTSPWIERASGVEGVSNNAFVAWRCEPPGVERRILKPTDADLRGRAGG